MELHLSGTGGADYLNLLVVNEGESESTLDPSGAMVHFEGGVTRRLVPRIDFVIPKGWLHRLVLMFPSKEDLRDQNRLVVDLPLLFASGSRCVATVEFQRSPELLPDPRTSFAYMRYELSFGAGIHFGAAGGLRDLGGDEVGTMDLTFKYWPALHHGWFVEASVDFFGGKGAPLAYSRALASPRIYGIGFFGGYSGRVYVAPWLAAVYAVGPGGFVLDLDDDNKQEGPYLTRGYLALREKLGLVATFARDSTGVQWAIAPTLSHLFVPFGSFGSADARGHVLTGMLTLHLGE
jgi:hypothetical protein